MDSFLYWGYFYKDLGLEKAIIHDPDEKVTVWGLADSDESVNVSVSDISGFIPDMYYEICDDVINVLSNRCWRFHNVHACLSGEESLNQTLIV